MKKKIIILVFFLLIFIFVFNQLKPLSEGISLEGENFYVNEDDILFLADLTFHKEDGEKIIDQEIFEAWFDMVELAEKFIIIDAFLFNNDYGIKPEHFPLTDNLKNQLITKKEQNPQIEIIFITDPINNFYGSYQAEELKALEDAGIRVIVTDLKKLRDSNPYYSSIWRLFFQWFGTAGNGWIPHPLNAEDKQVTLRSFLSLLNTKANHRKLIIADNGDEVWTLISSGNPHTASSLHSNVAFVVKTGLWADALKSEFAVIEMSGEKIEKLPVDFVRNEAKGLVSAKLLTEGKIKESLIEDMSLLSEGDSLDIAVFYLSDRDIIKKILETHKLGVSVRIILDPNKDAFGRQKSGIPNRQVAYEIFRKTEGKILIRWYDTRGEQFHTKMAILKSEDNTIIHAGSANLTRRNISDFNLETNLRISLSKDSDLAIEVENYFETIWSNQNGLYTLPFESFKEESSLKNWIYRFQEATGFSSF